MCTEGKRCLGAASHQAMSILPYRFLGYARNDDKNSAALLYFYAPHHPVEPSEPVEPAPPSFAQSKGDPPGGATPEV